MLSACGAEAPADPRELAANGGDAQYVLSSVVFRPEEQTTYISLLGSLDAQRVDLDRALELPGWGDIWVHDGELFVANGESPTITKYAIDDSGELELGEVLSFGAQGISGASFYANSFVAPDKAYMLRDTSGYVIWNPKTMEITGEIALPEAPEREGLGLTAGLTDRSGVIRDRILYQPFYWADEDFLRFSADSRLVAIDIESDSVLGAIDLPCPGIDVGTLDESGDMYFSDWTGSVYGPLKLDSARTCTAKVARGEMTASVAFRFDDISGGREGAAARSIGDGRLAVTIFHAEDVEPKPDPDPYEFLAEDVWRLWSYDISTGEAAIIEGIPANPGDSFITTIDGRARALVPGSAYDESAVYALDGVEATKTIELAGWGTRLFKLR